MVRCGGKDMGNRYGERCLPPVQTSDCGYCRICRPRAQNVAFGGEMILNLCIDVSGCKLSFSKYRYRLCNSYSVSVLTDISFVLALQKHSSRIRAFVRSAGRAVSRCHNRNEQTNSSFTVLLEYPGQWLPLLVTWRHAVFHNGMMLISRWNWRSKDSVENIRGSCRYRSR